MFNFLNRKKSDMWLLVGLGNPEDKYKNNRHNIGFMAADKIASDPSYSPFKKKFNGLLSEGRLGSEKSVLLKPQTYINESGQSVGAAAKFYKIQSERIIVFHDEIDLVPSDFRVKKGGGNAGHNGLKSIQAHLGTPDFWRVRMGVGHPGDKSRVSGYVLSDFAKSEQEWVAVMLEGVERSYEMMFKNDMKGFEKEVSEHLEYYLKK